jgi:uncharacterized protein (DUF58 family)
VLVRSGDPGRLEPGLSEAASLAVHLLRTGASVALVGPGIAVPPDAGRAHERTILTALALYGSNQVSASTPVIRGSPPGPREMPVAI